MKFKDEFWAFIPARSGSRGIKNKNIKKLAGLPLIVYSIKIALKIRTIKKVIFSSDSKKYILIAKKNGCQDFHLRSKKISGSSSSELAVFQDFVFKNLKLNKKLPKYFIHFRPTTPIRYLKTVNKVIKYFKANKNKCSSLRSATLMSNPAYRFNRIINNKLCAITKIDFSLDKYYKPRHFFPNTYICNCIIDIYKTENILKGFLFGNKVIPYITKDFISDIDDLNDFKNVEYYIKRNNFKI